MVKAIAFAAAALALSGQAIAQIGDTCFLRRAYCGYQLLSGSGDNYNLWKQRVDEALAADGLPIDGTHESNTLFVCIGPTILGVAQFCPANGRSCQPNTAAACGGGAFQDSCCA